MIPECELPARQTDGSISLWLGQVKAGQERPIANLLSHYLPRLVALASSRLRNQPHLQAYAEDVALSVFHSLCSSAQAGRFPALSNRRSLWQLLAVMTIRKTIDLQRKERRQQAAPAEDLGIVVCPLPTPEAVALSRDQLQSLLRRLDEPLLQQIVEWKMAGFANEEIATKLGCTERTVERKLHRVRTVWRTVAFN